MWFVLILLVVAFVAMALLAPKPKIENARASDLSKVDFPQATEAAPVPFVLGTVLLKSCNTTWYGDFASVPIKQKAGKTGGFLGIGAHDAYQTIGYKYYIGMDLCLCLGGQVTLKAIYAAKDLLWAGEKGGPVAENAFLISQESLFGGDTSGGGMSGVFTFYNGDFTQPRNAYLVSKVDSNISAYGGFCHIVLQHCYIGTSTSIKALKFELQRFSNTLGIPGGKHIINTVDINPMEAMYHLLTQHWGGGGLPSSMIDSDSFLAAASRLYDEALGVSILMDQTNQLKDVLTEIQRAVNGVLYQDPATGKIKMRLIRQDYDASLLPVLNESNVLEVSSFSIQTWSQTFNQMRVKFVDRLNLYEAGIAQHSNFANIQHQGRLINSDVSMPVIYDSRVAIEVAARELSMISAPLYNAELICNRTAQSLRPGDVVSFDWAERGISGMLLRVQKMKLGTLTDSKISLSLIQDAFSSSAAVFAQPGTSAWVPLERSPLEITNRRVEEAPWWLRAMWKGDTVDDDSAVILGVAGKPSVSSQSWSAYDSLDDFASEYFDGNLEYTDQATLVNDYNVVTPVGFFYDDTADGMLISGVTNTAVIKNATELELVNGANMFMIDGELFNFSAYTNVGGGQYRLRNIHRFLLDTTLIPHSAGARIWFLNNLSSVFTNQFTGTAEVSVKLIDNTDGGAYALADQPADDIVFTRRADRPLRPARLQADGSFGVAVNADTVELTWRERVKEYPTLQWENDGSGAPEDGTSYVVRVSEAGGTFHEYDVAAPPYTYTFLSGGAFAEAQVYSVLGGRRSRTCATLSFPFIAPSFAGDAILTSPDGDYLVGRGGALIDHS